MQYSSKQDQTGLYVDKFKRNFKNDKGWISFAEAAVIALIIKIIAGKDLFLKGEDTWLFILTCASLWLGIFNSITNIVKEKEIVKHEYRQGLSLDAYVASHMRFQLIVCLIQALIITVILSVFYFANLGGVLKIFVLFITLFLTIYAADALGLMISAIVNTVEVAMMVMPFVLMIQLVLSGFLELRNFVLQLISFFMISKNGFDGLLSMTARTGEARLGMSLGDNFQFGFYDKIPHFLISWLMLILLTAAGFYITRLALRKLDEAVAE